ncbi:cytochrome c [Aquimarina sp. 2201CG5-10]|uniref:c-type cytochrome n=1 Tax=Aquimarina callyspongiae TaxID=3098150 RepID=UPI002AB3B175|nr:cytochrome c [Aquimarina sp. 2201CG5-10]MDY8134536.1 cytochrome c [Aquimarina sp. 2201CG5-10]
MRRNILLIATTLIIFGFSKIDIQNEKWVAPETAKEIENTVAEKNRNSAAKKGKKIFMKRCAVCHGESAKGDGAVGARLNPKPADLTSDRVQNQVDGEIFWKITNGRGSMPNWGSILSDEERWNLVNFINTFAQ